MVNDQKALLTLMFLTVITLGCLNGTTSQGPESVEVQELSVNPAQIYEDSSTTATLQATNVGSMPAQVTVEEEGENILVDYCRDDIFTIEDFSINAPPSTEQGDNEYNMEEGDTLRMNWDLDQTGSVPLYSLDCDLRFQIPFNYTVQAFSQIQIKEETGVEGAQNLETRSSSGPAYFNIETVPGVSGEQSTYITEEDNDISMTIGLQNQRTEDGYGLGIVNLEQEDIEIEIPDELRPEDLKGEENQEVQESMCEIPGSEISLNEGSSSDIRCSLEVPEEISEPASIYDITAEIDYRYVKEAGTRNVEVSPRG